MAERKFTRALSKPGSAAQVRETVSQAVRESTVLAKPQLVEPIDYEAFVLRNIFSLQNDPQRDMLLYPQDDVSQSTLPRRYRTTVPSVPSGACALAKSLLVQECVRTYTFNWIVVHYKYSAYSGSYLQLPKIQKPDLLEEQVYEVDAENEEANLEALQTSSNEIMKEGYLLKGPEATSIIAIATQSFKRRYVYLRKGVDGSCTLEFHKDERKGDTKGTICLDFCTEVVPNSKRGKLSFELKMQESPRSYTLMAENEMDLEDWLDKLNQVVLANINQEEIKRPFVEYRDSPPPTPENRGTLKSLEHSRNPELMKYAKETDFVIAQARKENRQKLFDIYPEMAKTAHNLREWEEHEVEPYKEQFGSRILVVCESIRFRLQVPLESERGALCQVEPYITTMALYDAKRGKKISADFRFDVNHPQMRNLIPKTKRLSHESIHTNGGDMTEVKSNGSSSTTNGKTVPLELGDVSEEWLFYPKQAIFSVSHPDSEVYLVIRIEKVLQGAISQVAEPYVRGTGDTRLGSKIHKSVKMCCQRLGQYRMPFAWTARPLFKPFTHEVDTYSEFHVIYKQDSSKLGDEDLLKFLADFKKPDRISRLPTIPGAIKIVITPLDRLVPNTLTSSLLPVRPFPLPPMHDPTFEVDEFHSGHASDSYPYTSYVNHLYVCPKSLKYDTQKTFTKARNIVCVVEFRDSDEEGSQPVKCIYGKPSEPIFVSQSSCAVVHHSTCPDFYEEVRIALPTQLHDKHHILFTFLHVSCEQPKASKRRDPVNESVIGYAWIPVLTKGRIHLEEQSLSIASHLPPGYLSVEPFGLGKGFSGPEMRWVDGQKQLFKVDFELVSTIYTKDQHLHNFFAHIQRMIESRIPVSKGETCKNLKNDSGASGSDLGREMSKFVKALHAVDVSTIINFLPTLLNQLFGLLMNQVTDDVALNTVRVLVHIINVVDESGKSDLLHSYTKFVFPTGQMDRQRGRKQTVHEELAKSLTSMLQPANTDFLVVNKFLRHASFFFQVLVKSMAQYLLTRDMTKTPRSDWFSANYLSQIEILLDSLLQHIIVKFRDLPTETKLANSSLAWFIKKCLTFMDRGFVFKLINYYLDKFNIGDPKALQEYKFEFLQIVTSHEHYISLNLPFLKQRLGRGPVKNMREDEESEPDYEHEYRLSEEFCRNHFLVGLLLQEVRMALNEVREVRRLAISVLRNLLAKHSFDDRYQLRMQQARVASLYLPFIAIILENLNRLNTPSSHMATPARGCNGSVSGLTETPFNSPRTGSQRYIVGVDGSPVAAPQKHTRDSSYLALIASQGVGQAGVSNASSSLSLDSSSSTMSNLSQERLDRGDGDKPDNAQHSRSQSLPFSGQIPVRYDKLDETEVKDLLISFLYIIKNVGEELLIGWWQQCLENDVHEFLHVLEICLHQFRYVGRKQISSRDQLLCRGKPKSMTLPARMAPPNFSSRVSSTYSETNSMPCNTAASDAADSLYRVLLEANMATEVGLICLDVLGLYCTHFKEQLLFNNGDNPLMRKIFDIYISFLQVGQSEKLQRHVFAALRSFLIKFPMVLFRGNALLCGKLCYEILKNCNSRLSTTRNEACAILYLLMRSNFEFTGKKGLVRVHLQVIISVSQLLGEVIGLNNVCFQESLSIVNNYANTDKAMQATSFPAEVKDLTKRIRTVLMATTQMREHENDPEMLLDLQYSLANSYAATPELRKTWLESMAKNHKKNGNLSEAAHCYIHIAALVAEYLKQKGIFPDGCRAFSKLSPNVERDESGLKEDAGMQDMHYTEDTLLEWLERCAEELMKAERYELIGDAYRIIIPIYEKKRDYEALSVCYKNLHNAYTKIVEVNRSGKRLLGKFYRVAFFGQSYFDEDSGKEYIYKEPKVTSLAEISERLYYLYCDKFGAEVVKMIMDSTQVDPRDLDLKYAYIQVTHVTPHFEKQELAQRPTEFDRNNNLQRFVFETPFTLEGKARSGLLEQQCKRKTFLTTLYSFPYTKKRIPVFSKQVVEMAPIEVAIEEMQTRVNELTEVISVDRTDLKKLQLILQGSVSVQVNVGPVAYATAFLDDRVVNKYSRDRVRDLKEVFKQFVRVCSKALELNGRLIVADQFEYQESLRMNFRELVISLSDMLHEKLIHEEKTPPVNRDSFTLFSYISATAGSSTA